MPHPDPAGGWCAPWVMRSRLDLWTSGAAHRLHLTDAVRSPLFFALLVTLSCAARGPRQALPEDGAPVLAATATCTRANMETAACDELRRAAGTEDNAQNVSVARALEWLDDGVVGGRGRLHRGYQADSTGLLAMAWGESAEMVDGNEPPPRPASTTLSSTDDLTPGDALQSHGHALIFGGWTDAEKATAIVLEQPDMGLAAMHAVPRTALEGWTPVRRTTR